MEFFTAETEKLHLEFDQKTGVLHALRDPADTFGTNWIDPLLEWGKIDSFEFMNAEKKTNGFISHYKHKYEQLLLTVSRTLTGNRYTECYELENQDITEFFLTHDNFGIHFPYNCSLDKRPNLLNDCVVSHLWCGGDCSWIFSCKPNGDQKYLLCMVTEGSFDEYSQEYDMNQREKGAQYRGAFILHPSECIIDPGAKKRFTFVYSFSTKRPDEQLVAEAGQTVFARAGQYTLEPGERTEGSFEAAIDWSDAGITVDGKPVPFVREGHLARWEICFSNKGEYRMKIRIDGRETWMDFNVMDRSAAVLKRRAKFIREKQQYHKPGSPLDGAFLIYDRETKRQFYNVVFHDSNSAQERLAMAIVCAQELQRSHDPELSAALKKFRTYAEREIVYAQTGEVFNAPGNHEDSSRAYNYPWIADFYLELYLAEKDVTAIRTAAMILFHYFKMIEQTCQDSPCLEDLRVLQSLEAAGETELAEQLKAAILGHADELIRRGTGMYSAEVSYTQAQFYIKVISLLHAYTITGDRKYLSPIPQFVRSVEAFAAQQPSFHGNMLGVRWWDMFWFGKSKSFGDTMPQWLCTCCGEMYMLLYEVRKDPELKRKGEAILRNSLCVYDEDGFGCAGYMMPYMVICKYPVEHEPSPWKMPPGTFRGRKYDAWANDQDFSLYYAALRNV